MDKEEKDGDNKGEKDMQAVLKGTAPSFADFLNSNKDIVRKVVDSNTVKNNDGLTVISKDDPWRDELEWDHYDRKIKDK